MLDKLCAHAHQATSEHHHNADQNVLFRQNVHQTEHVLTRNVLIHAHTLVALDLFVMLAIITRFALVHLASPAIHSHNVHEFVSSFLF